MSYFKYGKQFLARITYPDELPKGEPMLPNYTHTRDLNEYGEVSRRPVARKGKVVTAPFVSLSHVGREKTRIVLDRYRAHGAWSARYTPGVTDDQRAVIEATEKFLQEFASTKQEVDVLKRIQDLGGQIDPDTLGWMGVGEFEIKTVAT